MNLFASRPLPSNGSTLFPCMHNLGLCADVNAKYLERQRKSTYTPSRFWNEINGLSKCNSAVLLWGNVACSILTESVATLFWSFVNERAGRSFDSVVLAWLFIQEVVIHHAIIHPCRGAYWIIHSSLVACGKFPFSNSVAVAVQVHNRDRVPCQ